MTIKTKLRQIEPAPVDQAMLGTRFDGAREAGCCNELLDQAQKLGFSDKERKALERLYGKGLVLGQ